MEDTYYNSSTLRYVYIIKFTFDTPQGVVDLFNIGHSYEKPNQIVLSILDSFSSLRGYYPRVEIIAQDKVMDYEAIVLKLKTKLYKSHYPFTGLKFTNSTSFYYTNPLSFYRELIPSQDGLKYEPLLPIEMMSKEELDEMRSKAIAMNEDGYIYKV